MAFVVIYDACVLYPAPLRDLLLRLAVKGLVRARWTDQILDECFRNILANWPDLNASSLQRTRDLMNRAIYATTDLCRRSRGFGNCSAHDVQSRFLHD